MKCEEPPGEAVDSELATTPGSQQTTGAAQWETSPEIDTQLSPHVFSIIFAPYLGPTRSLESLFVDLKAVPSSQGKNENGKKWSTQRSQGFRGVLERFILCVAILI